MINHVVLGGRLGQDVVLECSSGGSNYCFFSLAVNKKVKEEMVTSWFDVKAFGKTAEIIADRGRKGAEVVVEGEMSVYVKEGQDGKKQKYVSVLANKVFVYGNKQAEPEASEGDDW